MAACLVFLLCEQTKQGSMWEYYCGSYWKSAVLIFKHLFLRGKMNAGGTQDSFHARLSCLIGSAPRDWVRSSVLRTLRQPGYAGLLGLGGNEKAPGFLSDFPWTTPVAIPSSLNNNVSDKWNGVTFSHQRTWGSLSRKLCEWLTYVFSAPNSNFWPAWWKWIWAL